MTQTVDMDYAALARDTAIKVEAAKHDLRSWMASTTHGRSILHQALLEEALPGMIAEHGAKDTRALVLAAITLFTPDAEFTKEQWHTINAARQLWRSH